MYVAKIWLAKGNDWGIPNEKVEVIAFGNSVVDIEVYIEDVLCEDYYTYLLGWEVYDIKDINKVCSLENLKPYKKGVI